MSKKRRVWISIGLIFLLVMAALVGCGRTDNDGRMSEAAYKAKVAEMNKSMKTLQTTVQQKIAKTDPRDEATLDRLFEDLKTPFRNFAALKPPVKYDAAHAKFKSGCEAMVEYLELENGAAKGRADVDGEKMMQLIQIVVNDITEGARLAEKADKR